MVTRESNKSDKTIDALAMGIPGALSNRPPETAAKNEKADADKGNVNTATQQNDTRTERQEVSKQYENSRTIVHTRYQQGRLERINVSILLNQQIAPKGVGVPSSWNRSVRW
nr:flagellar M-ring protein FliF C-terminal domain-containing protein [Aeromonas veronii]